MMVWKWGDGNQSEALALPFSGPGPATFSISYQYSAPDDYVVQLVIYNLASSVTFTVLVSCTLLPFNDQTHATSACDLIQVA